jgi:hypothetical protein
MNSIISVSNNNNNSQYSLNDSNSYKCELSNTIEDIVNKYTVLLTEYLKFIIDNIGSKKTAYSNFIIERGLETITHVFTLLLYYSRNVDVAYYHGQRSFYFYVEFIGQISEDQHVFLNLCSRDAVMFVYKKTIFELSNDYRKNLTEPSKETLEKLDALNAIVCIFKNIVYFTMREMNLIEKNAIITNLAKHIEELCNKLLKNKFTIQEYSIIETFTSLIDKKITINKFYEIIDIFVHKYSKIKPESTNKLTDVKIKEKFSDPLCESKLDESSEKFIKWIFS